MRELEDLHEKLEEEGGIKTAQVELYTTLEMYSYLLRHCVGNNL